jgi:Phosphodiester glycosidase
MRSTFVAAVAILAALPVSAQFILYDVSGTSSSLKPFHGYAAVIDASSPLIAPYVTPPLPQNDPCWHDVHLRTRFETTESFMNRDAGLFLGINANLGPGCSNDSGNPCQQYTTCTCWNPFGLVLSDKRLVVPMETSTRGGPSAMFFRTGPPWVRVGYGSSADASRATNAVSGWIGIDGKGTLLVDNGVNRGATAQPVPTESAARTAIGTDDAGTVVVIIVIEKDKDSNSEGITNIDLASVFLNFGATYAVNLDGGGSSAFIYLPLNWKPHTIKKLPRRSGSSSLPITMTQLPWDQPIHSKPADGSYRPIGVNFGYKCVLPGCAAPNRVHADCPIQ